MAGEADEFFGGKSATTTTDGSLVNKVYIKTVNKKEVRSVSPTGVEYFTPARTEDKVETTAEAKRRYLTDPKLQSSWLALLSKNGFETDPLQARALWEISVDGASDWYATSDGQQKITPQQYLTWYSRGTQKKKGPALPTRQIYQVPEEQIMSDIDTVAQKVLGRTISDVDKAEEWYTDLVKGINKMYQKGTVTTVKEVVNPKTGKKEKQVVQTPGFSKEGIEQRIETTVRGAAPVDVERKERVDFTKWLFSQGGQG
jgi:hypothetical protein